MKQLKSRQGLTGEFKRNSALFLMLVPGLILLFIFNYLPLGGIVIAFKDINMAKGIFKSDWAGFSNFEFFVKNPSFPLIVRNTLGYNLIFMLVGNLLSLTVAIGLNELHGKLSRQFYQSIILLPYFLSWVAVSYLVLSFLSMDKGLINTMVLEPLGFEPVSWYQEKKFWPWILTFMNRWRYTGYDSVIYLAALSGLDKTYFEAAQVDGANKWQQITRITIPLVSQVIVIVVLLALGRIFIGDFDLFYTVPRNSGPLFDVTNVMDTFVYRALIQYGNISMAAAAGLFQSVLGFLLIITANSAVRQFDAEKSLF